MKLDQMISILRCPESGTTLSQVDDYLISVTGKKYPIINGKPILVVNIQDLHTTVPSDNIVSKNISSFAPPPTFTDPSSVVVHLGCGDVPSYDPRVISVDILPTPSADVVAEAEALPFATASIDLLLSGAVFEHLYDPLAAAAEVRRVLKEGAHFVIDTAFMQTYHGFPSHYFNMTPQAIETFMVSDFVLEISEVPESGTALYSILNIVGRLIENLPKDQKERFKALRVDQALDEMRANPTKTNALLQQLSLHTQRSLAASFKVVARKPIGYDKHHRDDREALAVRREYYAARVGLFDQHGQAEFYAREAYAMGSKKDDALARLCNLLAAIKVENPLDLEDFKHATATLRTLTMSLIAQRDRWIAEYLALKK